MTPSGSARDEDSQRQPFWRRFAENFGKVPEEKPPLIPAPYRIPFFITLTVVSLVALVALVWFVVMPGIQAQQSAPRGVPASAPAK